MSSLGKTLVAPDDTLHRIMPGYGIRSILRAHPELFSPQSLVFRDTSKTTQYTKLACRAERGLCHVLIGRCVEFEGWHLQGVDIDAEKKRRHSKTLRARFSSHESMMPKKLKSPDGAR